MPQHAKSMTKLQRSNDAGWPKNHGCSESSCECYTSRKPTHHTACFKLSQLKGCVVALSKQLDEIVRNCPECCKSRSRRAEPTTLRSRLANSQQRLTSKLAYFHGVWLIVYACTRMYTEQLVVWALSALITYDNYLYWSTVTLPNKIYSPCRVATMYYACIILVNTFFLTNKTLSIPCLQL